MNRSMIAHIDKIYRVAGSKNSDDIMIKSELKHLSSWKRCLEKYNIDPAEINKPRILDVNSLRTYQEQLEDFIHIAEPSIKSLYENLAKVGYVLLFGDEKGVSLKYWGDPIFDNEARRMGVTAGSVWSETIEGTAGVATSLVERRTITIHRDEHFRAWYINYSCSSTPLYGPDRGLIGTINITHMRPPPEKESQLLARQMLEYTARLIENAYFLRVFKDCWIIRFNSMQSLAEVFTENLVAINSEGYLLGANESAMRELCRREGCNPSERHVSDVFDIKFEDLMYHSVHKTTTILPVRAIDTGLQYYATFRTPEMHMVSLLHNRASGENGKYAKVTSDSYLTLDGLAGTDPCMIQNASFAKRVMNKDIPLLLIGETGTGKEVFARAVHNASNRASKDFVALNCASIPESLIESELFGYKSGSFTGANKKGMRGKILQSDGGTLFLDEIGDMPLNLQTRLLRVLAEKEISPLGSELPIKVDLQIICATHRNLMELVSTGQFREDLYYRLNGLTITLNPLRERQDRSLIIEKLLAAEAGKHQSVRINANAMEFLMKHPWPGNIRQLRNVLRYCIAVNESGMIRIDDLPPDIRRINVPLNPTNHINNTVEPGSDILLSTESDNPKFVALRNLLRKHKWNITTAAKELNIERTTLYRRMKKLSIIPPNELY